MKLPVLFVCEDNGLAAYTPSKVRQGYQSVVDITRQFDCDVISDDTTDVEQIFKLARKTVQVVRESSRPAFLSFKCFRYLEHVGIYEDFDAGYRSKSSYELWRTHDCVLLQRKRLIEQMELDEIIQMETAIDRQIEESIKRAQEAPFPRIDDLRTGVYYEGD
jgi:pyruvate dehydrogenase E1 component alpha subunit